MTESAFYEGIDQTELVGFARTYQEATEQTFALAAVLPNRNVGGLDWRADQVGQRQLDPAQFRAFDVEAPQIGRRVDVASIMGTMSPISQKVNMGEYTRLALDQIDSEIVAQAFNDARDVVDTIIWRLNLMRGETMRTAAIDLNENGVVQPVDFGRDPAMSVVAGTVWSDPNATILTDLTAWVQSYTDMNGAAPNRIIMPRATLLHIMNNNQVRTATGGLPGLAVTRSDLDQVLNDHLLPPIELNDEAYNTRSMGRLRVLHENWAFLVGSEPAGNVLYGTTAEALELGLIGSDQAGIVVTARKTWDPVTIWTKASAIAFPVLGAPNEIMAAQVL